MAARIIDGKESAGRLRSTLAAEVAETIAVVARPKGPLL